jgi:hypothetical protein
MQDAAFFIASGNHDSVTDSESPRFRQAFVKREGMERDEGDTRSRVERHETSRDARGAASTLEATGVVVGHNIREGQRPETNRLQLHAVRYSPRAPMQD